MTYRTPSVRRRHRKGAAVVEFAVVAPLLFMLILGIIEFGRLMMVQEIVTNGAREAARQAVLPSATKTEVETVAQNYFNANGISGYTLTTTDPATASGGSPITVTVSVPYTSVSWLPVGAIQWSDNTTLSAKVIMRKEKGSN
jgi:Flp pilus assembly protein TadG